MVVSYHWSSARIAVISPALNLGGGGGEIPALWALRFHMEKDLYSEDCVQCVIPSIWSLRALAAHKSRGLCDSLSGKGLFRVAF